MTGAFDTFPSPALRFGAGRLSELGTLAAGYGKRVLLVTDPGLKASGHVERALGYLETSGLTVEIFDAVPENPTTADAGACAEAVSQFGAEVLVALGGGSAIDTAKGVNILHESLYRPLIAIPTTAGTGSEVQRHAVLGDPETHVKKAYGHPAGVPKIALLDPELTLTCPPRVTACTGIDALSHAIESWVTKTRNALSGLCAHTAFVRIEANLNKVFADPADLDARGELLLGAALAGLAIENSMLGAAHAAANPLTARFGTVHGEAVGRMLPHVIRFNAELPEIDAMYDQLYGSSERLARRVEELLEAGGLADPFPHALDGETLGILSEEAAAQRTASFNPRPIRAEDFRRLYSHLPARFAHLPAPESATLFGKRRGW